ncbi:MAG: beta-propeller domain-containing protein [bacterium]|nr:beta-propeller domain-containing protein [bacterium]
MEENRLIEQIRKEAEAVEIPKELEPDQIRMRIETEKATAKQKEQVAGNSIGKERKRRFRLVSNGSRVAAAAIVLVVSLGALGVANRQGITPVKEEVPVADAAANGSGSLQTSNQMTTQNQQENESIEVVETEAEEPVQVLGDYHLASGYHEVFDMLKKLTDARVWTYAEGTMEYGTDAAVKEEAASEDSIMMNGAVMSDKEASLNPSESKTADYSTTNLQVTGVDESDIVKTDGKYIYIATNDKVQIVDATGELPKQITSIQPDFAGNMDRIVEMYVSDTRLLLIVQTEDTDGFADADIYAKEKVMVDMAFAPGWSNQVHTKVLTYDITAPGNAQLIGTFTQDGGYQTSRKIGDQLYLCTNYGYPVCYPYLRVDDVFPEGEGVQNQEEQHEKTLTPEAVKENLPKIQGQTIPENCIYLPKNGTEQGVLLASVDVKEPEKVVDQKLIFCGYSTLYVTRDTILLYCSDYDMASERNRTKLTKFAIGDGRITAKCAEAVPGYIEDTFAIHENKDGFVYVLTTDFTQNGPTNQLYVLDGQLKICGKIEHIADGETVYAARFVDEIGYFVTYRNMDPLFTVDFSNPRNPKLIGELEIPGFSDYLQFWDDTHLIGVGEERKEKDSEFVGIKVSLYDISDPTAVKESAKYVIDDACYAPAQYNYKALLADSKKNVIAFMTCDKGESMKLSQRIFTVEDEKLKSVAKDALQEENGYYAADDYRNLYIGDKLYLVREGLILVYDMNQGFERVATCKLK